MDLIDQRIFLDQIVGVSPYNVRQSDDADDDLSSLKATIRAVGLINPPLCHYAEGSLSQMLVLAGRRRWRALRELRDEDPAFFAGLLDIRLAPDHAGPAELIALSAMENNQVRPMHPVREYEAFSAIAAALPSEEAAIAAIAKEFGLAPRAVRQRLALGDLSPKIRAAWLKGDIDVRAARAYAECPDPVAQDAHFDAHDDWRRRDPHKIRHALLSDFVTARDGEVLFVGEEAYRAAGGVVRESLFEDERRFSGALVKKLVHEKLKAEGLRIIRAEAWGFLILPGDEGEEEWEDDDELEPDWLPAETQRHTEIRGAINTADISSPEAHAEVAALIAERDALEAKATMRGVPQALRATRGVFVAHDWRGVLTVMRGLIPPPQSEPAPDDDSSDDARPPHGEEARRAVSKPWPQPQPLAPAEPIAKAVRTVLEETAAGALSDACARSVNLALAFTVARLGCQYGGDVLGLALHTRRGWTPAHPLLRTIKQKPFAAALEIAAKTPLGDLTTAFCELIGAAVDPSRAMDSLTPTLALVAAADAIPVCIESDLKRHFHAADYFRAATKDATLAAIRELAGEAAAAEAQSLRKTDLTDLAARWAKDKGWLPQTLRAALAQAPAAEAPTEAAPREPDTRTTAEAMRDALEADEAQPPHGEEPAPAGVSNHGQLPEAPPPLADSLALFIALECTVDAQQDAKASLFLAAYNAWAAQATRGWPCVMQTALGAAMEGLGYARHRFKTGVYFQGVGLNSDMAAESANRVEAAP